LQKVKIILSLLTVSVVIASVFIGLFAFYSSDIAVTVHGVTTVANSYGSPFAVELITNTQQLPFHADVFTPVNPLLSNNLMAYYSLVAFSGHDCNIFVTVSAFGTTPLNNCSPSLRDLPGCTVCLGSMVRIPFGATDFSYDFVVTCPT